MNNELIKEILLLKLNPQYNRCKICGNFYHMQKSKDYLRYTLSIDPMYYSLEIICINCGSSAISIKVKNMRRENIHEELLRIEELYAHIYSIRICSQGGLYIKIKKEYE